MSSVFCIFIFLLLCLLLSPDLNAEFYEYIDENGVKTFTDNPAEIPKKDTRVHAEQYDHLSPEEKRAMRERDRKKAKTRQKRFEQQNSHSRAKQEKREKKEKKLSLKTPVAIMGNQILVPVKFQENGVEVTATLLLDTGASMTTINQTIAQRLNFRDWKESAARVAGGGIVRTLRVSVDKMQVGPKKRWRHSIMVLPQQGYGQRHQGLLGQDFLKYFNYTIDYDTHAIQWTE